MIVSICTALVKTCLRYSVIPSFWKVINTVTKNDYVSVKNVFMGKKEKIGKILQI